MILAGDVGGTKVHLALYDFVDGKLEYSRDQRYAAKNYSGLEEIVKEFLGAHKITAACFGVPGPVRNGRLRLTNLPWTLDSRELSLNLGITHVFLISGADKAEIVKEVLTGAHDPGRLPSQLIRPASGILTLILDKAAAALLPATDGEGCGVLERER